MNRMKKKKKKRKYRKAQSLCRSGFLTTMAKDVVEEVGVAVEKEKSLRKEVLDEDVKMEEDSEEDSEEGVGSEVRFEAEEILLLLIHCLITVQRSARIVKEADIPLMTVGLFKESRTRTFVSRLVEIMGMLNTHQGRIFKQMSLVLSQIPRQQHQKSILIGG